MLRGSLFRETIFNETDRRDEYGTDHQQPDKRLCEHDSNSNTLRYSDPCGVFLHHFRREREGARVDARHILEDDALCGLDERLFENVLTAVWTFRGGLQ